MAKKKLAASVTPPPPVGFWSKVFAILKSDTVKTIATMLLSILAGASAVGYAAKVTIENAIPHLTPPRIPKIPWPFKPQDAIGQTRFGNSGCSATIIKPRSESDNYVDILTAAHCQTLHAKGKMKLKDGRVLDVRCVAIDHKADVAWLQADKPDEIFPYLEMADVTPPPGSKVWHMGYGIDRPGNKEDGHVTGITPDNQKVQYRLSVSPGDSGGGIITTADNKVISPVCCTTKLGGTGDVWGGTPAKALAIRPRVNVSLDEPPAFHPKLELSDCDDCDYFWVR